MSARHLAVLISLLFVSIPFSHVSADEVESNDLICDSEVVNAGQEIECTLDLSTMQGVSALRFEYFQEGREIEDFSVLSLGTSHSCSILDNGSAICWGRDNEEQLGDGGGNSYHQRPEASIISPDDSTFQAIYAANYRTCALTSSGSLYCWGDNTEGQAGDGTTNRYSNPVMPADIPQNRTIVTAGVGWRHTCAILDDGSLMCWGRDSSGALGNGQDETSSQYSPVNVELPANRNVVDVGVGYDNTCVLFDDGGIMCWGKDNEGQNGDGGSNLPTSSPGSNVALPEERSAVSLSVGAQHSCAVLDNASLVCWGWNGYGTIGDNTTTNAHVPVFVELPNGAKVIDVDAGIHHTCAVLENQTVNCWGRNWLRTVGGEGPYSKNTKILLPRHVEGTSSVVKVETSERHTCTLAENGTISCWGQGDQGALGVGTCCGDYSYPVQLDWSTLPFAPLSGPAPLGEWVSSPMRGQVESPIQGKWNFSVSVPESAQLGNYSVEITMLKIGGIRTTVVLENVIEIIGVDSDRDGIIDAEDAFPSDSTETSDIDSDGVGDNSDAFPDDPNETLDSDSDGVGDNSDAFPNNAGETTDSDGDGVGDNTDAYPYDATRINPSSPLVMYAPVGGLIALLLIVIALRMVTRRPVEDKPQKKSRWNMKNPDRKF